MKNLENETVYKRSYCISVILQGTEGDIECRTNYKLIKSLPEMQKTVQENSSQIIDTRMDVHFSGKIPEPNDCKKKNDIFLFI